MTLADLDKMEAALVGRLRPWLAQADRLIRSAVADAHAHALKAVTDTLRQTTDGRPSARKVTGSPSYKAALSRLSALQAALIGPSVDSLEGLLRDARAAFYRDSVTLWKPHIPDEYRASDGPTEGTERLFRGSIIHGYDLSRELGPDVGRTEVHLFAALNAAGRKSLPGETGVALLGLWEIQSRDRLTARAGSILSDSDKAIHEATGWLMIKPEYRGERRFTAGGVHF